MIVRIAALLLTSALAFPAAALAQETDSHDAGGTHEAAPVQSEAAPVQPEAAPVQPAAAPVQPEAAPKRGLAPKDARAYIIWPPNGAVIDGGKLWVRMGLQNFGVAPAGVRRDNAGHHHLIIDRDLPPLDEEIPNNKNHLHFGGGQTEARIELPPGTHTLQMLIGDAGHIPHDPPITSPKITITVR